MTTETKEVVMVAGAFTAAGTLIAGLTLRILRWADWSTSFKDAFQVTLAAALLDTAYVHRADRLFYENVPTLLVLGAINIVTFSIGCLMLRRQKPQRALTNAFCVGALLTVAITVASRSKF